MSDILERIEAERVARSIDPIRPANPLLKEAAEEIRRQLARGRCTIMKPDPIYVTTEQGGDLIPFEKHVHHYTVHSIHFSDGSVFDCYNGWRDAAVAAHSAEG